MLHWLVGSCRVLGLDGQNWMLVIAGTLLVYGVILCVLRRRRAPRVHRGVPHHLD